MNRSRHRRLIPASFFFSVFPRPSDAHLSHPSPCGPFPTVARFRRRRFYFPRGGREPAFFTVRVSGLTHRRHATSDNSGVLWRGSKRQDHNIVVCSDVRTFGCLISASLLRPNSIVLSSSLAGRRPASEPGCKLDSVMKFGFYCSTHAIRQKAAQL